MRTLTFVSLLGISCGAATADVLPVDACIEQSSTPFTFSVVDDTTRAAFEAVRAADLADDGRINAGNEAYLEPLERLRRIKPYEVESETMVVFTWFPQIYIHGAEEAPEIRVFLRNIDEGETFFDTDTGNKVDTEHFGAQVFMPARGRALSPSDAAKVFVEHICGTRARVFGAADA